MEITVSIPDNDMSETIAREVKVIVKDVLVCLEKGQSARITSTDYSLDSALIVAQQFEKAKYVVYVLRDRSKGKIYGYSISKRNNYPSDEKI